MLGPSVELVIRLLSVVAYRIELYSALCDIYTDCIA